MSLHLVADASLFIGLLCMLIIVVDIIAGHRQHMAIMNFVYPITALYAGPIALLIYYTIGRKSVHKKMNTHQHGMDSSSKPFYQSVVNAALHCGSGCTLGDMIAAIIVSFFPLFLFGRKVFGSWVIEYILAFSAGIIFQYFSIKPMKKLSPEQALKMALKADALSLTFWQIGMYGWMAIAFFLIFKREIPEDNILFWFMMQIGMICGFVTSYPINWWLLRKGIKETM